MHRTLEELVGQLAPLSLPIMSVSVERYTALTEKTSCTNLDYQQVIELDPGFTLMVLRQSGEVLPKDHDPVSHIAHGVSLLGLGKVEQSITTLPTISSQPPAEQSPLLECYSRAAHAASYALEMGLLNRDHDPHELAVSALLFESAEMSLRFHQPQLMESLESLIETGEDHDAAAIQTFGGTLNDLSLALARQWRLPLLMLDALRPFGNLNRRALGVMLAVELARCTHRSWLSEETSDLLELSAQYLRAPLDQASAAVHRIAADTTRKLWGLPLSLNIDSLLQIPSPRPAPEKRHQTTVDQETKPAPITKPQVPKPEPLKQKPKTTAAGEKPVATARQEISPPAKTTQPQKDPTPGARPQMQPSAPESTPAKVSKQGAPSAAKEPEVKANTESSAPANPARPDTTAPEPVTKPSTPLTAELDKDRQTAIALAMRALRDEIGLKRCMFATISRDMSELKARFVIGAEAEDALRKFYLPMKQRHIFAILMKEAKGFWMGGPNREKYLPLIPGSLQQTLNIEGFVAASIFIDGLPLGLVYADPGPEGTMKESDFAGFKRVIRQLNNKLSPPAP